MYAEALRDLLNDLFNDCGAWISTRDLNFGSQILESIRSKISVAKVGIFCATPENATSPWLMFEAGAIFSGTNTDETSGESSYKRVIVIFFGGSFSELGETPLKFLYALGPSKEDFLKLAFELNELRINGQHQSRIPLEKGFNFLWSNFEQRIQVPRENWSPSAVST